MMEDEVAALVVDNGSGKSESTLECNKRAIVHFQGQTDIISDGQCQSNLLGQIFSRNIDFRPEFRFLTTFLGP